MFGKHTVRTRVRNATSLPQPAIPYWRHPFGERPGRFSDLDARRRNLKGEPDGVIRILNGGFHIA